MSFTSPFGVTGDGQEVENPNEALALAEAGYVDPDVETDQDAIAEQVFDNLATRAPGWQAHDGNLEVWLTEAWAEVASEIRALVKDVPGSIFTTYGTDVLGIYPGLDLPATGIATFTAQDDQGYTLDPGTTFALPRSGNDLVAFSTLGEAFIPTDSTSVDVEFTAVISGADANGLYGTAQLLDPIDWVSTITVDTPTSAGADAETPQDYLDRLSVLMRMIALRPVLPGDFAILALQVPGVARAIAMNLYDPVANTWTNARTVTLALADENGLPVAAAIKTQVANMLEDLREVNWVVHVIDCTYQTIAVTYDVQCYAGQNAVTVKAACDEALTGYLSPASYALNDLSPATAGGEVIYPPAGSQPTRQQVIRVNELISLLDRTLGVDYVISVKINGTAADYTMPNAHTLPEPGTITGTVEGGMT